MASTQEIYVYTGTNAATETAASNFNLMSTDAYDSTGVAYQTNRINVPASGNNYSYERVLRIKFNGTFTAITNLIAYINPEISDLGDDNLDLLGGVSVSGVTPINTVSSIATTTLTSWDSDAEGLDIQNGTMTSAGVYSDYLYVQLKVPSTVTTPGSTPAVQLIFEWTET